MISFTPPFSFLDSKRRKQSAKSKCDFLMNHSSGEQDFPNSILMQLNISTRGEGTRLEHLYIPLKEYPKAQNMGDVHLTSPTFSCPMPIFSNQVVLVVEKWNCDHCFVELEEGGEYFKLFMSDEDIADEIVASFHIPNTQSAFTPHPKQSISVQNMCGSCVTPYQLNLACFQHLSRTKILKRSFSACESLSTVTGNLVLCSNRSRIDFRGVRSMASMALDWKLVSGLNIEDVSTTIYMLVLKGCLGKAILLSNAHCYLTNKSAKWCKGTMHCGDVCDVIELFDIEWDKIPQCVSVSDITKKSKANIHVSRRGSVVIRLVFSSDTMWSLALEQNVMKDCNFLFSTLEEILTGKNPTLPAF
jgi:hypothetical protein